jgi:beta-1,2-mannosidase
MLRISIKPLLLIMGAFPGFVLFHSCQQSPPAEASGSRLQEKSGAAGWPLIPFRKLDSFNPVLIPGTGVFLCPVRNQKIKWEEKDVFNPATAVRGDTLYLLYRAEDRIGKPAGTSRIGLAFSRDGIHFSRHPVPVLYPMDDAQKKYEWEGGCEDPRLIQDSLGLYYMTYTAYDGTLARLMIATSSDLFHWVKKGPAFANAYGGKYLNKWSKSGSIVSTYQKGKIQAAKINGKYWMYWGDQNIWMATSTDLIHWEPLEMDPGEQPSIPLVGQALQMPNLKIILSPRPKKFDSDLVESGPPAILTEMGILLLYNGSNKESGGDSTLPKGTYCSGQALFDIHDPTKMIRRMDGFFMRPEKTYEINGQVNQVCFIEGLAEFANKWFLYYGTADSRIAVAVKDKN